MIKNEEKSRINSFKASFLNLLVFQKIFESFYCFYAFSIGVEKKFFKSF
jgi:hypothetical protein